MTKKLMIGILQSNKKVEKYKPYHDCPKELLTKLISILKYDKLFNVIVKEFSDYVKLKEIRLGTGDKQMLFLSFSFIHKYYPHFNIIDFIITTEYYQVTYRSDGDTSDRTRTNYILYHFGKTSKSKYHLTEQDEHKMWSILLDEYCKEDLI